MWVHNPGVGTPHVRLESSYNGITRFLHHSGSGPSIATTTVIVFSLRLMMMVTLPLNMSKTMPSQEDRDG